MKSVRRIVLTAGLVVLGGCTMFDTYSEVDALNEAQPVGSPFTQSLANEYKAFANNQLEEMMDYPDALHFARKGLAAASGEAVMPEPVNDWNLSANHIKELAAARGRLIVTFDLGAREIAPATAALAQAKYDCWIEQQEEDWSPEEMLRCKKDYLDTISELESLVQQAPQPIEPVEEPTQDVEQEPMVPEEAMYLVFFNWDSSVLSTGARNVVEAVAAEVTKNMPSEISVSGHADTSGSPDYNKQLAFKRAVAVKDSLVSLGVPENIISTESKGEEELLVETSDDVREPANRRVNITFK